MTSLALIRAPTSHNSILPHYSLWEIRICNLMLRKDNNSLTRDNQPLPGLQMIG